MSGRLAFLAVPVLSAALAGSALAAPGEEATPIANPDLERSCGLDIHVILDESASVGLQLAPNVRNAFRAFTTALKNTGSRMAVSEFSSVADLPLAGAAQRQYTTVTDATIAGVFEPYISSGYSPTGPTTQGTNWEDAFRIGRYFLPRARAASRTWSSSSPTATRTRRSAPIASPTTRATRARRRTSTSSRSRSTTAARRRARAGPSPRTSPSPTPTR